MVDYMGLGVRKIRRRAEIRNRYNQVPHLNYLWYGSNHAAQERLATILKYQLMTVLNIVFLLRKNCNFGENGSPQFEFLQDYIPAFPIRPDFFFIFWYSG